MAASNTISTRAFKLLRPLKGRLNLLLQDLVRTNSVAVLAGGDETAAQHVLHRFFDNSRERLMLSLLGDGEITPEELQRLKDAIAEAEAAAESEEK